MKIAAPIQSIAVPVSAFLLLISACGDQASQPPADNPPQVIPGVPFAPSPADGATGLGMDIELSWDYVSPDSHPMTFDVFFGRDTLELISRGSSGICVTTPWEYQRRAREMLYQIYVMQNAYRDRYLTFAANGTSASGSNCPSGFQIIGIIIPITDVYIYWMVTDGIAGTHFSCYAAANLDNDADRDYMTIDNTGELVILIQDFGVTFLPNTTYNWQVVSYTSTGDTIFGPVWHFTTGSDSILINHPPAAPSVPIPSDNYGEAGTLTMFNWRSADPDGDILCYDLYLGSDDSVYLMHEFMLEPTFISSWRRQQRMLDALEDIYRRQRAYHDTYGTYALNDRRAGPGDEWCPRYNEFESLGVFLHNEDIYWYYMYSSTDSFRCEAWTYLDRGGPYRFYLADRWEINQDHVLTHISEGCAIPYRPGADYYWKIVARDSHANETEGPVWHFTTATDSLFGRNQPAAVREAWR